MDILLNYFPDLTENQKKLFAQLPELYAIWNAKINVISRKDMDNLMLHHVVHSLALAKIIQFKPGSKILDLGTGGGFPGIPLAIFFPDVDFLLLDSIRKKITVVEEIATALELKNVRWQVSRVEDVKEKFDFVTARAVTNIRTLWNWSKPLLSKKQINAMPNGLFAFKGGDITEELKELQKGEYKELFPLRKEIDHPYFTEKTMVYLQG